MQTTKSGFTAVQVTRADKAPDARGPRLSTFDPTGVTDDHTVALVGNMLVELGVAMGVFDLAKVGKLAEGEVVQMEDGCAEWYGPPSRKRPRPFPDSS